MPSPAPAQPLLAPLDRLPMAGPGHPVVRRCSRVRRNLEPREDQVTLVVGGWGHRAALAGDAQVESVLWCPGDSPDPEVVALAARVVAVAAQAHVVSERTLARAHPGLTAPSLVSVVHLPAWQVSSVLGQGTGLVLVADGIEYAGNLGTLVRTADACGADALVVTSPVARLSHPKVFVASRGTVLTLPVLEYDDAAAARSDLAAAGYTVFVADPAAASSYTEAGLGEERCAVVVGSEGQGVCDAWRRDGLERVSIPMRGTADSLNVATSAAVLLFHARARRADGSQHGDGSPYPDR